MQNVKAELEQKLALIKADYINHGWLNMPFDIFQKLRLESLKGSK